MGGSALLGRGKIRVPCGFPVVECASVRPGQIGHTHIDRPRPKYVTKQPVARSERASGLFIASVSTQIIEAFRAFVVAGVKVILLCRVELRPLEFLALARRYRVIVVTRPVSSG